MRVNDLVRLTCPVRAEPDVQSRILEAARGKSVLSVGAAGGVDYYLPDRPDLWMSERLRRVAGEFVGIDIDREGIRRAAGHGYSILEANCETMTLDRAFDLIVMSDVIEHVEQPPRALVNLVRHLGPGGKLFVTTPNATFVGGFLDALLNRPVGVYYDHVTLFAPEHIQAACDRHGLDLVEVGLFTQVDARTAGTRLKSMGIRILGRISPRLHNSFLAVIQAGPGLTAPRP